VTGHGLGARHRSRVWWFAALVMLPAALAGIALLWLGRDLAGELSTRPAPAATVPPSVAAPTAAVPTQPPPGVGERERVSAGLVAALAEQPILFDPDSAELTGPSAEAVRRIAALLAAAPEVPVLVEGHVADTPGSPEVAQRLSERRAEVVTDALVAAGVDRARITARGRGAEHPLATPVLSRRVEVSVA
jgi:outer membrane protein OmpA-like peptidoglycan-associated protein